MRSPSLHEIWRNGTALQKSRKRREFRSCVLCGEHTRNWSQICDQCFSIYQEGKDARERLEQESDRIVVKLGDTGALQTRGMPAMDLPEDDHLDRFPGSDHEIIEWIFELLDRRVPVHYSSSAVVMFPEWGRVNPFGHHSPVSVNREKLTLANKLIYRISQRLAYEYSKGFKRGSSILQRAISGEISISEMDRALDFKEVSGVE